ncbi:hypothetical protein [Pedobacter sp. B4-66]|nr:hypothetical protein [Pedobacter sp. B4-66]
MKKTMRLLPVRNFFNNRKKATENKSCINTAKITAVGAIPTSPPL